MSKKYWTRGEEARLLELRTKGITDPNVLAKELGRIPRAVEKNQSLVVGHCAQDNDNCLFH